MSAVALLALTGCGGQAPDDGYSGPGPSSYESDRGSGELAGGDTRATTLAGGPPDVTMEAIPNPENLPLEERRRIYGNKYDHLSYKPLHGGHAGHGSAPPAQLRSWRNAEGVLVVSNKPIANPEDMSAKERRQVYGKRYAPRPSAAPKRSWAAAPARPAPKKQAAAPAYRPAPVAKAPAPKPVAAPPPKMVAKPAPPPVKAAPPPAPIAKAPPAPKPVIKPPVAPPTVAKAAPTVDPKMAALSAKVGPEAIKGATLTVPDTLAKGEEAKVTLALPVTLLDIIQREAANLGLTKAARKAEVSATLTGEGYTITPNGAQTQALKKGEAATFDWQVKPGDGEKTPLKATVDGALKGQAGPAKTFSIATLEQAVANAVETTESQAKKLGFNLDKLAIPGLKPITIGQTVIPPGALTAIIIAFVLLLVLLAMAQAGAARRARNERRRKFRTMTDYGRAEPEVEKAEETKPHVNPLAAAAGGAAVGAGAAALTFAPHEDEDHGHAQPEAHPAHEEHAPAHEAHAEPAAEAHAPAHEEHPAPAEAHGHDDHGHAPAEAPHHDHHAAEHREPEHA
ncbi:hypothetical protein GVN21_17785 [Caulobacter sp. SLTY]|uniref:hypothetical protein n=1 Tax=Caulobacter sp. SLTY TaxID=2683262 RepID=UPI0014133EFA|nr:hypothetical protein [Caulobacter sp. SLTY]NBB17216.1 hypothetical protein [Caulobacter sp. SLTY]